MILSVPSTYVHGAFNDRWTCCCSRTIPILSLAVRRAARKALRLNDVRRAILHRMRSRTPSDSQSKNVQ